ncbi:MAG TPA: helix-turn-helix transcriptional regulator, partial [Paracoccaceae bacterium]|nr:helix-turn-helix transcriptional regulator [Paracoccaceae bacterium]
MASEGLGKAREAAAKGRVAPHRRPSEDLSGESVVAALGARVKRLRSQHGLTLEQLAEQSGVSRAMLSKVERGEKSPTLAIVARIARGLNISLSALLGAQPDFHDVVAIKAAKRLTFLDPETGFE